MCNVFCWKVHVDGWSLYDDEGFWFHKGWIVAKKIDAWIKKEMRDLQHYGCTVAYKENNPYNIYMKPKGNRIDAMPTRLDPNLQD